MEEERQIVTTTRRADDLAYVPSEAHKQKVVYRTYNSVWFIVGIIETLLAFRFVFEVLGASTASGFTQFIYMLSYPFAQPFQSIFRISSVGVSLFDWSLVVAAVVYLLIGYGIIQLLRIIKPLNQKDLSAKVNAV